MHAVVAPSSKSLDRMCVATSPAAHRSSVHTDASDTSWGVVLQEQIEHQWVTTLDAWGYWDSHESQPHIAFKET